MQADDLVSIIVPVYNAASYIEQTMKMVVKQDYSNWELLLVDDCSTDGSVEVIKKAISRETLKNPELEGKFVLLEGTINEGAACARNRGIEHTRGRYIAFLDADDIWFPEKLSKELAFMKKMDAAFVCCAYEFGDEQARGTGKVVHVPQKLTYRKALSRTVVFTTTVLLDTSKTGKELIRMPNVKSEDTATWWKIMKQGFPAYGLDEVLAIYRRPPKSLSSNKLKAIRRIWYLYRKQEKLSVIYSLYQLVFWAARATLRRI